MATFLFGQAVYFGIILNIVYEGVLVAQIIAPEKLKYLENISLSHQIVQPEYFAMAQNIEKFLK